MWETGSGEEWDLLTTSNGVHDIDGRDTSLNHLLGIVSLEWVDWLSLDIEEILSKNWRTVVDGSSLTIELATKHLCGDRHAEHITSELTMGVSVVNVSGTFENLYDGFLSCDFEHLTLSGLSISELDVDDLGIFGEFDIVEDDEGTFDIEDSTVVHTRGNVVVTSGSLGVDL